MTLRIESLPQRRAIIDRRALADALAALDGNRRRTRCASATRSALKAALDAGRAEIERRLVEHPSRGLEIAGRRRRS